MTREMFLEIPVATVARNGDNGDFYIIRVTRVRVRNRFLSSVTPVAYYLQEAEK